MRCLFEKQTISRTLYMCDLHGQDAMRSCPMTTGDDQDPPFRLSSIAFRRSCDLEE